MILIYWDCIACCLATFAFELALPASSQSACFELPTNTRECTHSLVVLCSDATLLMLAGPTGLDMLAYSYDTDQASDPPTPRAALQRPQEAGGDVAPDAADAPGFEEAPNAAAAAADADDAPAVDAAAGNASGGTEAPAAAADAGDAAAGGAPFAPEPAEPMPPAPVLPPATQAIMAKLIGFVKVRWCPGPPPSVRITFLSR